MKKIRENAEKKRREGIGKDGGLGRKRREDHMR